MDHTTGTLGYHGIGARAPAAMGEEDAMMAGNGSEARAVARGAAAATGAPLALGSVLLDLCARRGARQILCIGPGGESLSRALRQAGYAVWGTDPSGNPPTGATGLDPAAPPAGVRFDLAFSTESPESCAAFGARVACAAGALRPAGLFLLPTPYRDSLLNRIGDLYARWRSRHNRSRGDSPWSKPRLQRLLESHGFVLVEVIGVRDASRRLRTVVWVAQQSYRPQVAGNGGCGDRERSTPPPRHGRAPVTVPPPPRLNAGAEPVGIQALLGQESISITPMDTHVGQARMEQGVGRW